jgi:hypothetical protein
MHPWMLQQVAEEHRRDLLDQAGRWPTIHRRTTSSSQKVQVASWSRYRFRFARRRQPVPRVAMAGPAAPSASSTCV